MKNILVISFLVISYFFYRESTGKIKQPQGILIPEAPIQHDLEIPEKIKSIKGKDIIALADFEIRARVLSTERYWFDNGASFSPIDLALGWEKMSDTAILNNFEIDQHGRFYFYSWDTDAPITENEIISSSSNIHIIPDNEKIKKRILKYKIGELVHLKGKLVQVEYEDGGVWVSSLSRTDTGDGACELFYVTEIL